MNLYDVVDEIDRTCFTPAKDPNYPRAILGPVLNHDVLLEVGHSIRPVDVGPGEGRGPNVVALLHVNKDEEVQRFGTAFEGWPGRGACIIWHEDLAAVFDYTEKVLAHFRAGGGFGMADGAVVLPQQLLEVASGA